MIREQEKAKQLKSQLDKILGELSAMKQEISDKQREVNLKSKIAEGLSKEITKLGQTGELHVTEHALIRYFERVKGFDIEAIKAEILSDSIRGMVDILGGSGTYPNNGFSVVMKNGSVTTIIN